MRMEELPAYGEESCILACWQVMSYMDSGAYSHVFRIRNRQTGEIAVLKFIPNPMSLLECREEGAREDLFNQARFAAARREAEIMRKFRGDANIVQYVEEPEYLTRSFDSEQGALFASMPC